MNTASNTASAVPAGNVVQTVQLSEGYFSKRSPLDWLFALALVVGGAFALYLYGHHMDVYEKSILVLSVPFFVWLGWFWRPLQLLMVVVTALSLLAIGLYRVDGAGQIARSETVFGLKYFLSSQSAILWMSVLFFMSTLFYWVGLLSKGEGSALSVIGTRLAWLAVTMALVGTMARWYESYLMGPDIGHIPVSNLYEVFVLFAWMTALFYLYFEQHYQTRSLGAFVMLVVSAAVGFLLWYTVVRQAHEIQPLVPALKSWWMKLHVPANFVGYGTFALAAMVALAYLLKSAAQRALWLGLILVPVVVLILPLLGFRLFGNPDFFPAIDKTLRMAIPLEIFFAVMIGARAWINRATPKLEVMDDLMYKAIAVGFAFFTIATVLGALWAAEAWGGYWSWDPKETWALIVWLNYAAWLHMRLVKGLRGTVSAWWALVGLVVTTFAFLGVNMFLSGLHSYGTL
ncbi:c-type cytochrome biogenesis protein CcsB [Comamonas sp. J-3]|uniref:c-type cytochrome biogenesis protein CcsB n=1 Tax=Comamonas trifloxystrobinivorans TaxID=3350256 RepID=UPI00372AEE40